MRKLPRLLVMAALAATGLTATVQPASSVDVNSCGIDRRGALPAGEVDSGTPVLDCDLVGRVITGPNGARVTVPEPGIVAGISSVGPDGEDKSFQVSVSQSGKLTYPKEVTSERAASEAAAASADPSECSDTAYSLTGTKAYSTYKWYVGDGTMPAGMPQDTAIRVFGDAIRYITGGRNNCRLPDQISATSKFLRKAVSDSNVSSNGTCTARDTFSIWDAGDLNAGALAVTCWWAQRTASGPNKLIEADVKFNIVDHNFTNQPTTDCSRRYDVRGVGTHEAGHVFGMGHVRSGHSNLTMFTNLGPCTAKARSLGRGDLRGLQRLY